MTKTNTQLKNIYQTLKRIEIEEQITFEVNYECYFKKEPSETEKSLFNIIATEIESVPKNSTIYFGLLDDLFDDYIYNKRNEEDYRIVEDINACARIAEVLNFTKHKYYESAELLKAELINMFNYLYPDKYLIGSFCEICSIKETEFGKITKSQIVDEHYKIED